MALPVKPPIAPMLAKLQPEIPREEGWRYEPKWDGFRTIVFRDGQDIRLASRDHKPMNRYFPELEAALLKALPARVVVDGEIVLAGADGRLDFDALQQRIHPAASRVKMLSEQTPVSFVAFDLLGLGTRDLRRTPLSEQRSELEKLFQVTEGVPGSGGTQILLTPQTDDPDEAAVWFDAFEGLGLDGIIAKKADLLYTPGQRAMVKVKHRRTADVVVGGYRLSKAGDGIGSLLLGLYDDAGVLHFVGHTSSFKAPERREILAMLRTIEKGEGFGRGRTPGEPSRWSSGKELTWYDVEPRLVCEVSYDFMQGDRFRHAATFIRWRDDKKPRECTFDQVRT
jgi:ATP-dependent DNA ligase